MTKIKVLLVGVEELMAELERLNSIKLDAIKKKQLTQMLNRARNVGGAKGTPVSTEKTRPGGPHGELRMSSGVSGDEMGYTKDYAPHVEYGHRTVNGGFVQGQRYLQKNVDKQREIFKTDIRRALREEKDG